MSEGFNLEREGVNEEVTDIHHEGNLHDLNETTSGEVYDLATGKKLNNSRTLTGATDEARTIKKREGIGEDLMGSVPEVEDEAEKWLRENDPDYKKAA